MDPAQPETSVSLPAAFGHPGVARAYRHRPPYPDEVFDVLEGLITDRPRTVLDIGAGEGALARPLARRADHVDALDISAAMVTEGRERPGGRAPNLRWIVGAAETAPLGGPYALVTAGASLHWMSWRPTLERLAAVLTPAAFLAIVEHGYHDPPWRAELNAVIARHSRSPRYDPDFALAGALVAAGLFEMAGHAETTPRAFRQRTGDYIEQFHSTASLAREWMPAEEAASFGREVRAVVAPFADGDVLQTRIVAQITWGRILAGSPLP
jgi:SAM-dependent methyltransferase